jgi:hypothetical protein
MSISGINDPKPETMEITLFGYLKENWGFILSVGYIYLTLVGMAFSWRLYQGILGTFLNLMKYYYSGNEDSFKAGRP